MLPAPPAAEARLSGLVRQSSDFLTKRILHYAKERGYTRYTPTLEEAWRLIVNGLSLGLLEALETYPGIPELNSDEDFREDPIAAFGILEAQRHRARGVDAGLFLGLTKYVRQSYVDLVLSATMDRAAEEWSRLFVTRYFDRIELGFLTEWMSESNDHRITELCAVNRTLANEKNKYLTIFESLFPPIILLDSTGRIEVMNHAAASLAHRWKAPGAQYYAEEEVPERLLWLEDEVEHMLHKDMNQLVFERTLGTSEGPRQYEITLKRMLDVSEKFSGITVVLNDITKRAQAEAALTSHNVGMLARLEATQDLVHYVDSEMRVVWSNRSAFETFQAQEGEVHGEFCYVLRGRSEGPCPGCPVPRAIQSGEPCYGEVNLPDGRTLLNSATPVRLEDGVVTGVVVNCVDITKRKQSEHQRLLLATALDQLDENIVIMDTNGIIEYVNPAFERTTGYANSESIGRSITLLKSAAQENDFYERVRVLAACGDGWSGSVVNRKKDGTEFEEKTTLSPVRNNAGEIAHFVAVMRDVSRELALEEQLRQVRKMEAIGRLAGGVAHDFNNLLSPILGYSEMAMLNIDQGVPLYGHLKQINQAGERAADLTRQLLAFSRKQVLEMTQVNLNVLITNFEKMLRRMIGEDVELHIGLAPSPGPIKADKSQIEQILMNLAVNARDAMPNGGTLSIETSNMYLDEQYVRDHAGLLPGEYVMLAVSDTGCGMTAEVRRNIFEPFFTTKEAGKGTGLGLATVYGIVNQHGGNIWVYSEPGQGTTFKIFFPRSRENEGQEALAPIRESKGGSETVLLIEDDPMVRGLAREVLAGGGYEVIEAETPEQAFAAATERAGNLHILLTDVIMPRMNGQQVYGKIAEICPEIKVLYMSGYTGDIITHHGVLDEGMNFLPKPFSAHGLLTKVRQVLDS